MSDDASGCVTAAAAAAEVNIIADLDSFDVHNYDVCADSNLSVNSAAWLGFCKRTSYNLHLSHIGVALNFAAIVNRSQKKASTGKL